MGLSPFPQSTPPPPLSYLPITVTPRPPPNMPLPALPAAKRPIPQLDASAAGVAASKRGVSASMLPTLSTPTATASTPTYLPRKSSLQALRPMAARSMSNLHAPPRTMTPTEDRRSSQGSSQYSQPQQSTTSNQQQQPSHRRNVSIGSFPRPPKGTGPRSPLASPVEQSPSIPSGNSQNPQLAHTGSDSPSTPANDDAKGKSQAFQPGRLPRMRSRPSMIPAASASPASSFGLPTPPPSAVLPNSAPPTRAPSDYGSSVTQFDDADAPIVPLNFKPRSRVSTNDSTSLPGLKSRQSSSKLDDSPGNVVVSVRVRPLPHDNDAIPNREDWSVDSRRAAITYKGGEGGDFRYDNVFTPTDDNERVYDSAAKRLVRRVMEGYNGTVFAYGITGTGKTFSMQGTSQSPGIIPQAITDIFSYIREHPDREFLLRVSYLEIYNERIHDLLSDSQQDDIKLREDSKRGVYATPLREEIVQSPTQLARVIARGDVARRIGSTQFNVRSSRSHAVVQIVIESRVRAAQGNDRDLPGGVLISTLSLIDLAGSERASEDKERRTEGSHINKSLLTLGTVISKLSGAKGAKAEDRKHLPYRDSKLTRLLQSALSGDALISILCTVQLSPLTAIGASVAMGGPSDTLNTLNFASRAKNNIVSHAKRNESLPASDAYALLDRYRAEIEDLKRQVEMQNQKDVDTSRVDEEEEERWLEREREATERHEEQMLEMQIARTALKERISHLNRLILSSKSAGVNASTKLSPHIRDSVTDGIGLAFGSPQMASKDPADAGNAMMQPGPNKMVGLGLRSFGSVTNLQQAVVLEEDETEQSTAGSAGEASPSQQVVALQADLADKNRYIATLERRLLEQRRLTSSKTRKLSTSQISDTGEDLLAERDKEIAELKSRLDDQIKMVQALRNAARRREMTEMRSYSAPYGSSQDTSPSSDQVAQAAPVGRITHSSRPSLTSPPTRNINFSRVTPVVGPVSGSHSKSMTDITQTLDQMMDNDAPGMRVSNSFTIHELPASPVMVGGMF